MNTDNQPSEDMFHDRNNPQPFCKDHPRPDLDEAISIAQEGGLKITGGKYASIDPITGRKPSLADNQPSKNPSEEGLERPAVTPIIPDNQDWLDLVLQHYKEYVTGVYQGIADYDEETARHAITTKIAEERQSDYKESLAELEIAMHHELDLMENRLLKELPTATHQVLADYIYRRHREIESKLTKVIDLATTDSGNLTERDQSAQRNK